MIKNCAWWSDIGEIRLTACNAVIIYNNAEKVIYYVLAKSCYSKRRSNVKKNISGILKCSEIRSFLFELHFRRLILKSPSNITSLFSLIFLRDVLDIHD